MMTKIKSASEIAAIRESGRINAGILRHLELFIKPGISTYDLAQEATRQLGKTKGLPAFLGYQGFPAILCVSVNEQVVHGIPKKSQTIHDGDIVSIDFGVSFQGMITDAARSIVVGTSEKANNIRKTLLEPTKQSLDNGIKRVKPNCYVNDISASIEATLQAAGLGIVRDLVGHGVGHKLHEEPNIPNYSFTHPRVKLKVGMTIAIEPMATTGTYEVHVEPDGWTVSTNDGSLAAHFEDTVLVTEAGFEILTR